MAPRKFEVHTPRVGRDQCQDCERPEQQGLEPAFVIGFGQDGFKGHAEIVRQRHDAQVNGVHEEVVRGQHAGFKIPLQLFRPV